MPSISSISYWLRNVYISLVKFEIRAALSIDSHLTPSERWQLYQLAKGRTHIVEIGSYLGASACCFAAAYNTHCEGIVCCIDTWNNDAMSDGNRNTFDEFQKNTAPFSSHIKQFRGWSTEVVEDVAREVGTIDLLFIDGDHSYEGAKADWESYRLLLAPGALVVFHDWGWAQGVQRVVLEDVKPLATRIGSLPNLWWAEIGGPH